MLRPVNTRRPSLPVVLLLALLLWAWGIGGRGVHVHDEAHFLLGAHTMVEGARALVSGQPVGEAASHIRRMGGTLYFTAKPGHVTLLALVGACTGGVRELPSLWLSLMAGLGVVALTYALCRDAGGRGRAASLAAALLVAVSPLMLTASRSALGLATSALFALLAAWLMADRFAARRPWAWAALAGAFAFASVACHYNAVILLGALALGMVSRRRAARWAVAGAVFAVCLLAAQAGTMLASAVVGGSYPEFRTYFGELLHAFTANQMAAAPSADGVRGYGAEAWGFALRILAAGFVPALVACGGALVAARRWPADADREGKRFLLCWALVPLVFWLLYPWKVERAFVAAVPGVMALTGAALGALADAGRRRTAVLLLAVAVVPGLVQCGLRVRDDVSPFAPAARAAAPRIAALPPGSVTLASAGWRTLPQWKWYLGPWMRRELGAPVAAVDFGTRAEPRVVCVDHLTTSSVQQAGENGFVLRDGDPLARAETGAGFAEIRLVPLPPD